MADTPQVSKLATELRTLADWLDAHPEQAATIEAPAVCKVAVNAYPSDTKDNVREWARAFGGRVEKEFTDNFLTLVKPLGDFVSLRAVFYRSAVCTKVVTGTRTVTREIPDPAAPTIEVVEEVEDVEWVCEPLLAEATQ